MVNERTCQPQGLFLSRRSAEPRYAQTASLLQPFRGELYCAGRRSFAGRAEITVL